MCCEECPKAVVGTVTSCLDIICGLLKRTSPAAGQAPVAVWQVTNAVPGTQGMVLSFK